ncbi:proliferation marker protein Ki-67 isoform X2 [Cololabis saira]|uniref:proliferation marker protein Ki-67 isoform X2 n=1 Tax=Cololabis saira TaxID=129043 RepID=UPI002AD59CB3|nr:proliferation marker protein Ki-67 isoform X2 [Cololabis saira]
MPLHGKVVVIKRSGGDGTEFPLTATCLFGRKPDCDIRIQLPQVSKEHCRIDLNENKEIILTNLSTTCPTRVNGEPLNQSERLKHGDMITIVDRSFRFEYPPAPTPKKRSSTAGKTETLKVLHDQQVCDTGVTENGEKKISEVSTDPPLKDGANQDNIQRSLEKTVAVESQEDGSQLQSKTNSPFSDLYQMIKMSLDVKTPRKSSVSQVQTPSSKFCTPKPGSVRKNSRKSLTVTPKKDEAKVITDAEGKSSECPQSVKKEEELFKVPSADMVGPGVEEAASATKTQVTSQTEGNDTTSQKLTVCETIEEISAQSPKSPMRRRSKAGTPAKPAVSHGQEDQATMSPKTESPRRASPRNSGKAEKVKEVSKKRKSGEPGETSLTPQGKRKRVSFGGYLSPELFDKKLPPNSPLQKGATPRRSLTLYKPKQSLLRRASVIGLLKARKSAKIRTPSPKKSQSLKSTTPETQPGKKVPKSRSPSPKAASPAQKTPKSRSPSPKAASPAQKTPKSRSPSPKAASPAQKTPKSRSPSPKAASPTQKTPKSRSPSPKAASPAQKTPKSKSPSPKAASPAQKTPKSRSPSPKAASPTQKTPKSRSPSPKAASPAQKTPKSRSPSPKAASPAQKTPKSRSPSPKAASPAQKTPKSRSASPKAASPAKRSSPSTNVVETPKANEKPNTRCKSTTPGRVSGKVTPSHRRKSSLDLPTDASFTFSDSGDQTPSVQGRFSVSRIDTPSPTAEADTVTNQEPLFTLTPKVNLKRKSMKTSLEKTPGAAKSASKILQRKSGMSRASIKCSWADRVKFGQIKAQVVVPAKKTVNQKTTKKTVPKPQTPARRPKNLMSTGHAQSPATIVVGRAHSRPVAHPTGAAPRLVTNTAIFKKDMKMDEDFTGFPEMFKTPANERKRRSLINKCSTTNTPAGGTSVMETVLNTPEEPGEMIVSPLTAASTVKSRQYNSEAVQRLLNDDESSFVSDSPALDVPSESSQQLCTDLKTPKQKTELPECLTGVKRILKTPRQKAEPIEDIRGKLLVTPKQKPEQQECLTGVKRIFKTPKQKAEPLEDLRGKLLKTPKVKDVGDVDLEGVKELLKTPKPVQKSNDKSVTPDKKTQPIKSAPVASPAGIKRTMKNSPVEDKVDLKRLVRTPKEKGKPVEENYGIRRLMKSPKVRGDASVEDFEGLKDLMEEPTGKMEDEAQMSVDCDVPEAKAPDANGVVADEHSEVASGCGNNETSGTMETHSKEDAVDGEPEKKKSVRGRRGKIVESEVPDDKKEASEASEHLAAALPVRGRRGKKTEVMAPSVVRPTRGRNAKATEIGDVEPTVEESVPEPPKVAVIPKRGRNAKKVPASRAEIEQEVGTEVEMAPEPECEQNAPPVVEHNADESAVPVEKAVQKPKRGRRAKQPEQSVPQQEAPAPPTEDADIRKDEKEATSNQPEALSGETKSSEAIGTVLQTPESENVADVETSAGRVTEINSAVVPKKSVRGRRAKPVETKEADDKQETAEELAEPVIPAPARGRRGKKMEDAAPPAVKQTRTRIAKSHETTTDQPAVETQVITEISSEVVEPQAPLINASQEKNDSAVPTKSLRGRNTKSKVTSVEPAQPHPEESELMSSEGHVVNPQPEAQQPIPPAAGRAKRGRKTTPDAVEQNDVNSTTPSVQAKQESRPAVRTKRGRNAILEAEEKVNDVKTTSQDTGHQEPVKKLRRTRKTEEDQTESKDEVQTMVVIAPEETETPATELPMVTEQASVASKPKRGGRKVKPVTDTVDAANPEEVPVNSTDKPKRGRRGRQVTDEAATAENLEHKVELEEQKNAEPSVEIAKPGRARATKTSVKNEVSQSIPAKRARRGAAQETTTMEMESVPAANEVTVSSDQTNLPEDSSKTVTEETKKSKRCVKWKSDLEVFDIPKETPMKAVRGRKAKPADQVNIKSKTLSKDANKTEEEDLSDNVAKAQPVKRGRRGAKDAAGVTAEAGAQGDQKLVEDEIQPKTRRGRSVKK